MIEDCATENPEIAEGQYILWLAEDALRTLLAREELLDEITKLDVEDIYDLLDDIYTKVPLTQERD